jgi:XRE family transcriptional regulator, fatty acid utilization regulator
MSVGERLRYAREKVNRTLEEVSTRTGIGVSSLSEYESDKRQPRLNQLQALADFYRKSMAFFLEEGPIAAPVVLWREKPEAPVAGPLESEFLRLCEQYHNLEVWCGESKTCVLPKAAGDAAGFGYPEAERLAYQVAAALQLGDRPGQTLLRVLEEVCRLKVLHLDLAPGGAAASTVSETFGPAVLLNAGSVRWRRNFDLAHELFHLLTWDIFRRTARESEKPGTDEEKLATCFASRLLMPDAPTKTAIQEAAQDGKLSFAKLYSVARQFDVSVEALLWRMTFLLNRGDEETKRDIEKLRTQSAMLEDRSDDRPPSRPPRFRALAVKALRDGEISLGRFSEYLGISRREGEKYLNMKAGAGEKDSIALA